MQSRLFRFAEPGGAIFSPWSAVLLLALESSEVIGLRVAKLPAGALMRNTKRILSLAKRSMQYSSLAQDSCATTINVLNRFREQVAANARRLSAEN
jgi:hypothetical protein